MSILGVTHTLNLTSGDVSSRFQSGKPYSHFSFFVGCLSIFGAIHAAVPPLGFKAKAVLLKHMKTYNN